MQTENNCIFWKIIAFSCSPLSSLIYDRKSNGFGGCTVGTGGDVGEQADLEELAIDEPKGKEMHPKAPARPPAHPPAFPSIFEIDL